MTIKSLPGHCVFMVAAPRPVTAHYPLCPLPGCSGALAKECVSLYPGCRVTVFDIPAVVQAAKTHFLFPEEERIDFREGECSCALSTGKRVPGTGQADGGSV